jgi:hypothetical protein
LTLLAGGSAILAEAARYNSLSLWNETSAPGIGLSGAYRQRMLDIGGKPGNQQN